MTATTAPRPPAPSQAPARRRLDGVDVARALAILGMVTVHFGPFPVRESGPAAWLYGSFHGKASVLFVVVAGIGIALMERRGNPREVRARLVYRTVWLLPLGLWLQTLDHPVAVILQYYALYFLLVAPFVGRSDRAVLGWGAGGLAVGSALVLTAQVLRPEWIVPLGGDSPTGVVGDLLLFGYYPAVTWVPVMLAGVWLGRRDLRSPRAWAWLVGAGSGVLVATAQAGRWLADLADVAPERTSWWWALATSGHAKMPLAVVGAIGLAFAVLGASLAVADRWPRLLWPLVATGRVALSVYVGHLLVFDLLPGLLESSEVAEGLRTLAGFGAVAALGAMAWLAVFSRGPLEAVVRWPWQHLVRPLLLRAALPPSEGRR